MTSPKTGMKKMVTMYRAAILQMNIRATIEATVAKWGKKPEEINNGECFDFATVIFSAIEGSKIAGHNVHGAGHTYIEYMGRCYDAERPRGVKRWRALPFFKRIACRPKP